MQYVLNCFSRDSLLSLSFLTIFIRLNEGISIALNTLGDTLWCTVVSQREFIIRKIMG